MLALRAHTQARRASEEPGQASEPCETRCLARSASCPIEAKPGARLLSSERAVFMNAQEHYRAGHLQEALAAATADVKSHPADTTRRGFLCELLCFAGDWERADRQLDALAQQDPEAMVGIS